MPSWQFVYPYFDICFMDLLGLLILPIVIAAGVCMYGLFCKYRCKKFVGQIKNFVAYCSENNWQKYEESFERIVFRRPVSNEQIDEICNFTEVKIVLPDRCHLYEYYFVTNTPEWQECCEFIVKHHGGLQLHHNFVIEIDGLLQPFISAYRSINQIAKGDDYAVWNYGYFIEEDKKFAYRELAEKVYPKRMDDYRKFMKHLKLSYCESASS